MAMTKIKGLQQWCRRMTDGYAHVDVANFTTAWRDGLAFCAIIHRFRPDLIDYDSLSPENVFDNCKLAFEVAEKELDIPAFLEAEDMARLKVPDKLSVITYVSQYYNFLHALPQLGGPGVKGKVTAKSPAGGKRPPNIDTSQGPSSKKVATGEDGKENVSAGIEKTRQGTLGDKCNICQNRVYLLERHIEAGKLYHRSCYRHSELSPTNKVYTRSPFLSPSLSKETPPLSPSAHVKTSSSNSDQHQHQHRTPGSHHHLHTGGGGGGTPNSKATSEAAASKSSSHFTFSTPAASADSPRKIDSAGSKHSLAETDRGDAKKTKLQAAQSSSDSQNQKANAIRDRLKNLKEKYESPQKTNDSISAGKKSEHKTPLTKEKEVFPLSGKESRQLEKRKEEILSLEKQAEKSSRAGARNVPLIFQKKDTDQASASTSASSVLSNAKSSSTVSSLHSLTPVSSSSSSKISSTISNTPTSTKNTNSVNTDPPQRKTALRVVKAELVSKKESEDPNSKSSVQDITKKEKEQGKNNTKSAPDVKDSEKADIASLQKKFLKSGDAGSTNGAPHPVAKARMHKPSDISKQDKDIIPTPALRKADGTASATPKAAPRKSHTENSLKVTPPNSARSSGSESPPPLPSTAPPPLPTSPPPSLPPSAVINLDDSPSKSKTKSSKESKPGGDINKSGPVEITTHGPVKSRVAGSSQVVATTSNKRFSSPAIHDPPLAVFVTPPVKDKEEKQVLTGLLASLAGVRGRSSSVPGISGLPITTASKPTASASSSSSLLPNRSASPSSIPDEDHSSKPVSKTPKRTEKSEMSVNIAPKKYGLDLSKDVNKTPSAATSKVIDSHQKGHQGAQSVTPSTGKVPEALSMLNNLKKVKDSKPSESSDSIIKTSTGSTKIEIMSQNTHTKEKKKNVLSASRENLNHISTKPVSTDTKKQESQDYTTGENFKTVKLKQVNQPDAKPTSKSTPALAIDVKLKKDETRAKEEKNKSHQLPTNVSKTQANDLMKSERDAISISGTNKSKTESTEQPALQEMAKSKKPLNFYEDDELPDWKAALEERKKKLRGNTAKQDSVTVTVSEPEKKPDIKNEKKSDSILTPSKTAQISPRSEKDQTDFKNKSPRAKSPSPGLLKTSDTKAGVGQTAAKTPMNKQLSPSSQPKDKIKSSDWKQDAEMKIAALGGFDSEEEGKEEKQPTRPKRTLPKLPDVVSDTQKAIMTNDKAKSKANIDKGEREKRAEKEMNLEMKSKEADKEPVPEFLTGISKLKHVELPEENKQPVLNTKKSKPAPAPPQEKKEDEDFRKKLQNLKHVHGGGEVIAESKNLSPETVTSQETTKTSLPGEQKTPALPKLTQPLSLGGDSKNTNNNKSKDLKMVNNKKKLLMDSINLASSPDVSDEEDKNGKNSPPKHSTPILENGKASPKAKKKKIPFFGKNKKEKLESPAESPINPKKKIEAPVNIDFDKSLEFESSLPDAMARLTIEGKKTPPQRPPPPQVNHQKVVSPKHISAIELQQQLLDIDSRLTDLELRGRDLEDSIRNVNVLEEDDDSLMIKWFELVSEKNDLVRQEADLVYMSREQDLETEQDHIEFQLRYLMGKPEAEKSAAEKEEEEYLIQRKLELVEQRNRIVDSMDEDRLRYVEEDRDIEVTLRDKGLWKDSNGTFKAIKGKRVSNSTFYT